MQLTQTIHILPALPHTSSRLPTQPTLPGLEPEPDTLPMVTNRQIAEVLSGIANVLEFQNSNPYRIQAYRNAARGILDLVEPAAEIIARGDTLPVPGLGRRLRGRIRRTSRAGSPRRDRAGGHTRQLRGHRRPQQSPHRDHHRGVAQCVRRQRPGHRERDADLRPRDA